MSTAIIPASQVRIGRRTFPFTSFEHVSDTYVRATGVADVGMRDAPKCEILDPTGKVVAHVSYNGRIWNHLADGSTDYSACLYDPVGGFGDWRDAA
jgi:hypothetical protein